MAATSSPVTRFQPAPLPLEPEVTDDGLLVYDSHGLLAALTTGAKTVTMRGQMRMFTEQKRPFHDPFERTVSTGFGPSPGGGNWVHGTGTSSKFSVDGFKGIILIDVINTSRWATIFDEDIADVNVTTRVTLNEAPTGASCSVSLVIGYTSTNDNIRARLLFTTAGDVRLALEKEVGGTTTTLGSLTTLGTGWTAGERWHIRAQRTGSTVRCRAWIEGGTEPSTWTHSVTETDNAVGRVGVRAIAGTGNSNQPYNTHIYDLEVESCQWANPPTVTHNTWARILDEPFDGNWTPALAQQIRRWAASSAPDVLAYAMMFDAYALPVTDPRIAGLQVLGQSQYGPLGTDGKRIEASDFNDYIGVDWMFPNGESRSFPHGDITINGCLDCSGYVRMVYGYHLGMPLTYHEDYDGLNIPRNTADQSTDGPGVVVASGTSAPPSMDKLMIGDVLYFDADLSDPEEGTIDHCGIYLGLDTGGHPRFISSRKTMNGPTFCDVGGASKLDGSGTYATRFRKIRRF